MRTIIIVCLLVVQLLPVAVGQEVTADVQKKSVALFGEKVGVITSRPVSAAITNLCPEAHFYTATIKLKPADPVVDLPTFNPPRLFVVTGKEPAESLSSPEEICRYLGNLQNPVPDELTAYHRALVFAELLGGAVRSELPEKESVITKFQKQKQENWPVVIKGTRSDWNVSLTLMTDRAIEYCVRYTLRIQKDGKAVGLEKKETVYTYTLYE